MCGRCRQIFNAFQSLSRVEEPLEAPVESFQEAVAESADGNAAPASPPPADATIEAVAGALFLREESLPLSPGSSSSEPLPRTPIPPVAQPEVLAGTAVTLPTYTEDKAKRFFAPHAQAQPSAAAAEPAIDLYEDNNPLLVEAPTRRAAYTGSASHLWRLGVFVLFFSLLAQAAYTFRALLVANYPQLRPVAMQLCGFVGCSISWGRDETAFEIIASELIEAPGKPGRILLTATFVNRGKTTQDLPSLELRLTDNANQVVVSRLLHPGDYLGRTTAKDEGMAPNTELYVNVNLNLELSNKPPASGYGLIVFYP